MEFLLGAMLFLPMAFALTQQAMHLANQQCRQFAIHTQALQKIRRLPAGLAHTFCPSFPAFIGESETKVFWDAPSAAHLER